MQLLKTLAMPFQAASLLFVAISALILAIISSVGGPMVLMALLTYWLMLVWLTQFALKLIDDAANGVTQTHAASAEMLSVLHDGRCIVHPLLAALVMLGLYLQPALPRAPVIAAAAILLPASIGAMTMSGRAVDAVNPRALARVVWGLGGFYALAVLFASVCALAGWLVIQSSLWSVLKFAALELLVLLAYAFIGGALHMRRLQLEFLPRVSPERTIDREHHERIADRQRMIDEVYTDLRVRQSPRAIAKAGRWFQSAEPALLRSDLQAILDAGANWTEPRGLTLLLRGLVPQLLELKQLPLAMVAAEAGLKTAPDFAPDTEATALALVRYAQHTGRRKIARTLLDNFLASVAGQQLSSELRALQQSLAGEAPPA
jgi:hypothetical protein